MARDKLESTRLHIVVTCTNRKRHAAPPQLRLGSHNGGSLPARLESWIGALRGAPEEGLVPVGELYAGDHWQRSASLPAVAAEHRIAARLWVCSAGYGLLPGDSLVQPYSATFSRGHPDAVWRTGDPLGCADVLASWWGGLARWAGPTTGAPRTLRDLADSDPSAGIWVVASASYLNALHADLRASAQALARADRLVIISAGARRVPGLASHALDFDWRLQGDDGPLGGAAMSLNVRVAELLLRGEVGTSVADLNGWLRSVASTVPVRRPKVGIRVSEAEVERFLREEMRSRPGVRRTPLLRKLRDDLHWAFEEKRFARLYDQVRMSLPTSEGDR